MADIVANTINKADRESDHEIVTVLEEDRSRVKGKNKRNVQVNARGEPKTTVPKLFCARCLIMESFSESREAFAAKMIKS